jgi:hypothetical protein
VEAKRRRVCGCEEVDEWSKTGRALFFYLRVTELRGRLGTDCCRSRKEKGRCRPGVVRNVKEKRSESEVAVWSFKDDRRGLDLVQVSSAAKNANYVSET